MKRSNVHAASLLLWIIKISSVRAFLAPYSIDQKGSRTIAVIDYVRTRSIDGCQSQGLTFLLADRNDHGYERDPIDDTRVDEDSIHELLAQRTEARQQQAFGVADTLRDRLLLEHGVRVSDSTRQWRTGCNPQSGSGMNKKWGLVPTGEGDVRRDEERRQDFRERGPGRFQERPPRMTSRRNDGPRSRLAPYREGDTQHSITREDPARAATIQALVDERDEARWERDYRVADAIQQDLLDIHGIEINDKKRLWRAKASGNYVRSRSPVAMRPPPSPIQQRSSSPTRPQLQLRGSTSSLTDDQVMQVEQLLQDRAAAQERKDFARADRIRETLRTEYTVGLDDRSGEWWAAGEDYDRSPVVIGNWDEELVSHVKQQVRKRSVAKLTMDYETADRIRDELLEQYQVTIDDKAKLWFFMVRPERVPDLQVDATLDSQLDDILASPEEQSSSIDELSETDSLEYSDSDGTAEERLADEDVEDLSLLKVPELKERLRAAGLPVSGRKAELIERLSQK